MPGAEGLGVWVRSGGSAEGPAWARGFVCRGSLYTVPESECVENSGARVVHRGSADPTGPWGSEIQNDKESRVQHLEKAAALLGEWESWGPVHPRCCIFSLKRQKRLSTLGLGVVQTLVAQW